MIIGSFNGGHFEKIPERGDKGCGGDHLKFLIKLKHNEPKYFQKLTFKKKS